MGEVYRATDAKLRREVAIKVLPEAVASDPERLARLHREAQVLASLNHPNIAAIYGIEDSKDTHAIVMELVEGPTLADRIAQGPIPVEEALPIAKQIAEALEAAHEQGIIHRDLKPANIKVRPDGTVKVLDFGLAKALEGPAAMSPSLTQAPTITTPAMTQAGLILGTAAYMSPEQATGRPADRRSDIFSFGAILFEMLTGTRTFKGDLVGEALASVMKDEPDWTALPPETPVYVRDLLHRCLAKDRRRRLQAIGEARLAFDAPPTASAPDAPARTSRPWPWMAAAAVLGLAFVGLAVLHFREAPPAARVIATSLLPPAGAEFDFVGTNALPALSRDGRRLVFGARSADGNTRQLWIRRLDSATAQPLAGTEGGYMPFWSPDSRFIAFAAGNALRKLDTEGGAPATVTTLTAAFRGGSWGSSGTIVFSQNPPGPVWAVSAQGGTASTVTKPTRADTTGHRFPFFLPDGRHFLFTAPTEGSNNEIRVASLDAPGQPGTAIGTATSNVQYASGHLLYLRGGSTLVAQPFDVARLKTTGDAVPVAENVPAFMNPSRVAGFTTSATGLLVHQSGGKGADESQLVWIDRKGTRVAEAGAPMTHIGDMRLSPDQKSVAVELDDPDNLDVWTIDLTRGVKSRFTFGTGADRSPLWSPDGRTLLWTKESGEIWRKAADGSGTDEPVAKLPTFALLEDLSPDGRMLLYRVTAESTREDLWLLPLAEGPGKTSPAPRPLLQMPFREAAGRFSPDGRWLAYVSTESGAAEVYVMSLSGQGGRRQVSSGGGDAPVWRRDGRELFFRSGGKLMAAEVSGAGAAFEIGRVQVLFDLPNNVYDVAADGQRFLAAIPAGGSTEQPLTLVENWPELVKR
jgi:eukaryotic-like serine/threonine-protein kinase